MPCTSCRTKGTPCLNSGLRKNRAGRRQVERKEGIADGQKKSNTFNSVGTGFSDSRMREIKTEGLELPDRKVHMLFVCSIYALRPNDPDRVFFEGLVEKHK